MRPTCADAASIDVCAPAGRNILDHAALRQQGFVVYALGKPLDPFLRKADH
jgi:hypothetical protein